MRIAYNVPVNLQCRPCVGMAELALYHFRRCSRVERSLRVVQFYASTYDRAIKNRGELFYTLNILTASA